MKTFRDKNKDLQYLIRDLLALRKFNDEQAKNGTPNNAFLFAEAAVLCVSFERFLRIVPAIKSKKEDTLRNLLERAFSKKKPLFKEIHTAPSSKLIKVITNIRNGILHGNFEQLAEERRKNGHSIPNTEDYFKKSYFAQDMEIIFQALKRLIDQVNALTGKIIN